MERAELHKCKILVNKKIISLCRCASIWTNIFSELERISNSISNRILLDNFNFKIMFLVKKLPKVKYSSVFFHYIFSSVADLFVF